MKTTKIALFALLFCIIPSRVLIQWLPLLGLPFVSTSIVLVEYASLLYLLVNMMAGKKKASSNSKLFKGTYILYWIYSAYLIYYVIINPQMPRELMAHITGDNVDFVRSFIVMGLIIPVAVSYRDYLDYRTFAKISTLFMAIVLLAYTLTHDMTIYLYEKTLTGRASAEFDFGDYGMISSLTMGEFTSIAFFLSFSVKDKWFQNKLLNTIIFALLSSLFVFLLLIFSQRGPVLFLVITILFYYYSKGKIGKTLTIVALLVGVVAIIFGDAIAQLISKSDFTLVERFLNIQEDGGSGRFGSSDSEYSLAFNQIMDGPLFGSYFRMTNASRFGDYPHNFILELLMTWGFVFTIPFLIICWYAVKRSFYSIKHDLPMVSFCLLFINVYSCHLTSFSIAASTNMWLLLAMVVADRTIVRTVQNT